MVVAEDAMFHDKNESRVTKQRFHQKIDWYRSYKSVWGQGLQYNDAEGWKVIEWKLFHWVFQ